MKHLARICAATLLVILPVCLAQATHHKKKPDPKPEPTAPELSAFVRGELLSLSPDDRINDNLEVTLDSTSTVLTVTQPDGHCDLFLNALDANTVVWDIFDATDSFQSREKLLRLTVVSVSGKTARTCYDRQSRHKSSPIPFLPHQGGSGARLSGQDGQGPEEAHCPQWRRPGERHLLVHSRFECERTFGCPRSGFSDLGYLNTQPESYSATASSATGSAAGVSSCASAST
jgi:hypothetical protein